MSKRKGNNFKQGIFTPKNPGKWRGNIRDIVYRSSWELSFCKWADNNPNVLEVSSEEVVIPYMHPFKNNGQGGLARYFIDFWIRYKDKDGTIKQVLIEIKPKKQTIPPELTKTKTGRNSKKRQMIFEKQMMTYMINKAKWEAAEQFAKKKGMEFIIITEDELFGGLF